MNKANITEGSGSIVLVELVCQTNESMEMMKKIMDLFRT